ncbi:MAG: hypothetical protein II821_03385 [Treponema sp.]|nr:hypothetical protein [Treponema sp.]
MTYLFFDIECANCFDGIGKICSFGYVLCDENFSVIETDDLLMNPAAPFDWYLFKKDSKCKLAYSREDYINNPKFPEHYNKIKALLETGNRIVLGFGCQNDVATISTECMRYDLDLIDFNCHDIHTILEKIYDFKGGLGAFVEKFGISTEGMEFHDSRADAFFTMKVTEHLFNEQKKPLREILTPYTPFSSKLLRKQKIKKLYSNYLERKEAGKSDNTKPPRPLKKITVPSWFDFKRELLEEIKLSFGKN